MANDEHLRLLAEGPESWHAWRAANPNIKVDLTDISFRGDTLSDGITLCGADLSGADLSRSSLWKADLRGVNFRNANLHDVILFRADLRGANLTQASLINANLGETKLDGAILAEANLHKANFTQTNLSGAVLRKANLSGAYLIGATFTGCDLAGASLTAALIGFADLSRANLSGAHLSGTHLGGCRFHGADLRGADLSGASLRGSILSDANLQEATLLRADLSEAVLTGANCKEVNLREATLRASVLAGVDLSGSDLTMAQLVGTDLRKATLRNCRIYGTSAWDVGTDGAVQDGLIITPEGRPAITVDNLNVGQFLYLFLHNRNIRDIISATTSKMVLILGRFRAPNLEVLEALRQTLPRHGYVPVIFDFEKPPDKDTQETVVALASLTGFVIADLTDARSIPQELVKIVEGMPSVVVAPIQRAGDEPWGMYDHIRAYPWVLPIYSYDSVESLLEHLDGHIIGPVEAKRAELRAKR